MSKFYDPGGRYMQKTTQKRCKKKEAKTKVLSQSVLDRFSFLIFL